MTDPKDGEQSCGREPVERLAESFFERYRRGERPTIEEYVREHPHLAAEIRELFPALMALERVGSRGGGEPAATADAGVPANGRELRRLGEYRILREIGRGGMGIVYEAEQESLGRHVALKVLPYHSLMGEKRIERFLREARAAARLHHPHIVPVFGVGAHEGVHYYAMQFIRGQSLNELILEVKRQRGAKGELPAGAGSTERERLASSLARGLWSGEFEREGTGEEPRGAAPAGVGAASESRAPQQATAHKNDAPTPASGSRQESALSARSPGAPSTLAADTNSDSYYFRSVARVAMEAAEALAYAHGEGILHRDIKPSNLLLDTQGAVWVTDFGLAKAEGSDALTLSDDIVGTVPYMAPERFEGWADPRSDIYGLGLTLYELLTLRPAFDDTDRHRLMRRISHEEPPRPRAIAAHVPHDLETIVLKAIAKEPGQRYQTAAQLAEDLGRFLRGQAIRARPPSTAYLLRLFVRRHPAAVAAGTVAALIFLAVLGSWIVSLRSALRLADERELKGRRYLYAAHMNLAQRAWEAGTITRCLELLNRHVPGAGDEDLRGFEWHHLWRLCHREAISFSAEEGGVAPGALVFSPDGRILAAPGYDCAIRLWDVRRRQELGVLRGHTAGIQSLAFSPDGRRLASGSIDKTIKVWDVASLAELATLRGHSDEVITLCFAPDGKGIVSGSLDASVKWWDVEARSLRTTLGAHGAAVSCVDVRAVVRLLAR